MRQALSLILTFGMLTSLTMAAPDTAGVTTQINAMSVGTNIELRLKTKEKLRGARGTGSPTGFTLVNPKLGDRQIHFDEIQSVKLYVVKSHTTRNILIGVGIALGALAITGAILLRCGPLGCHPNQGPVSVGVNY
jgi:hypothetical protein